MCHCYGKITVELVRIRAGFVRQKVWKLLNLRTISGVNSFDNGRFRGGPADANKRLILVRFVSSKTNSNSPHFEQSFFEDGGKTWEVNSITGETRVNARPDKAP
jgi:hypothetical protein